MTQIKGVWIANQPHSQFLTSRENIKRGIEKLVTEGFNTVFPVVWTRGYTLYPSGVMSGYGLASIDPFYEKQQRDPLAEIVAEARQHKVRVIPWFEYGFAASHLANGGQILQGYPHWEGVNHEGKKLTYGGLTWMNSFHPEVQQFMLKLVLEVLQYDVEGVQGCDRFPAAPIQGGYDDYTIQLYKEEFNCLPPTNYANRDWLQWRASLLTDFLARLYEQVKQTKPEAIVSLSPAVYPFCLDNLLQDSLSWVENDLVDWIHPQIYRSEFWRYRHEVNQIKKQFAPQYWHKFSPGIALKANNKALGTRDLAKCRQLNRKVGFAGEVVFHY